jgi:formylglycine-generating enzyme required for sulfatase activity
MKVIQILALLVVITGCGLFKNSTEPVPKPEMVYVEGGTFIMGDVYDGKKNPDATPTHQVTLSDFKIGKYEVTYNQYDAFAKRTGRPLPKADSALGRGDRAVVYVSWSDAQAFCEYHGWRLPTEQEWEYAARAGGKKTKFAGTNDADSLDLYARIGEGIIPYSHDVGSRKPNALGLYDMSGNVFEWIGDYYQFYPEKGEDPSWDDMEKRTFRIMRGGSYDVPSNIHATYWRAGMLMDSQSDDVGFRCLDPLETSMNQ